jgi:hypothetical protein
MIRTTYTYAVLDVSAECYAEIRAKLAAAGYEHAFHRSDSDYVEVIDMHGIALATSKKIRPRAVVPESETMSRTGPDGYSDPE